MPAAPSPILRANRPANDIGTSPALAVTPYTAAALDYRASWIGASMAEKSAFASPAVIAARTAETNASEARSIFRPPIANRPLPPPMRRFEVRETSGVARSLSTNIPDVPTSINVNSLRQARTVLGPENVAGIGSYDARVLVGNWSEEQAAETYTPSVEKEPLGGGGSHWNSTHRESYPPAVLLPARQRDGDDGETEYRHSSVQGLRAPVSPPPPAVLGKPVPGKQRTYGLDEYRARWTKREASGCQSIYRLTYAELDQRKQLALAMA